MLISTTYFYGQNVEFTIKFDEASCTYGVYATPDFTNPAFIFAGGSQISIVVPASVDNAILDITTNTYGWADSSQIYAPAADTSSDFHGVSANGGVVSFTSGVELLMFSFELPNSACCAPGVRLFDNATDPQSTDSGMGGGDFNNYFADALLFTDYYNGNYGDSISIPAPTGDAAQAFCTIDSPTVSSLVTNEADVVWYNQSSGGTAYAGTDNLVNGTIYYGALEPGSCVSSNRLAVTVTLNTTAAPTGDASQDFCSQDSPTIGDLVTVEGSTTWYNQASGGTAYNSGDALSDGTIYYGEITANGCVSTSRFAVTANVYTTSAPTGDATQNFCSQDTPTIADLVTNEGSTTWYNQASGGTAYNSGDALSDGTIYYGEITENGCVSTSRFAVTTNVYTTAAPTGDATQNFCSQDTPTIADLVTNEGSTTWYNQASGGTAYNSGDALSDGTIYYGEITANGCVSTSRFAVTANVYTTAAPTGDATQNFCSQDSPTVGDLVTVEGSTTWYNQASGGTAYNNGDALSDGTIYYGEITANGCVSTSRFAVTANVYTTAAPTGDATQNFCSQDTPTIANLVTNEGSTTWYNQASGGTAYNSGDALSDGTIYYGEITVNGCVSTSRFAVTANVYSTLAPTGFATQEFCTQDNPTIADLTTNESNVTWYNQASGGTAYNSGDALSDGTIYYGEITANGCVSTSRLAVTANVGNIPAPTGDAAQAFCTIDSPTVADIVVNEAGVVWYDQATGGTAYNGTDALVNGETYYGSIESGTCVSTSRLEVTVTLNTTASPTTSNATQDFCIQDNPTIADLSTNEGSVTWYNQASGGTAYTGTDALTDETTYYGEITQNGCPSTTRLAVAVNVYTTAAPTGNASQDFCSQDSPTIADLVTNEGSTTWYNQSTGGTAYNSGDALSDGTIYYGEITQNGCVSTSRFAVTANVYTTPAPTTSNTTQNFCSQDSPTIANLSTNESNVTWYDQASGGTAYAGTDALTNGTTYYGEITANGCVSTSRLAVSVNVYSTAAPTGNASQSFCGYDSPTVASLSANESNVTWYNQASGGTAYASTDALVTSTIYYGEITQNGCVSTSRLAVTVTLTTNCDVTLNIKMMLHGALSGTSDGLMRDDLRTGGHIPEEQPYSSTLNARFTHVNNTGDETTNATVLSANDGTGDAVVDWVFIEIRNPLDDTEVIKTISALVQRDGDVVDAATGGALRISSLPQTFYVAVKHRNHFGAMTANPITASMGLATIDFTSLSDTNTYHLSTSPDNVAMNDVDMTGYTGKALFAGNANYDNKIKYDGINNDRQTMGSQVLSDSENTGQVLNFNAEGYLSGDINMDGTVKYDGAGNERQVMQNSVITYPLNTGNLNNYNNMIEQIPQ